MLFEPIAIISQACLFPGANNPEELWRLSAERKDSFSLPEDRNWLIDPRQLLNTSQNYDPDHSWTLRGGYIKGFDQLFDPHGFALAADSLMTLDPLFQWPLHVARQALEQTRYDYQDLKQLNMGVIFSNLSYPSHSLIKLALQTWLQQQKPLWQALYPHENTDWHNRFMSGLPAHILAQALRLTGPAFTLDAACGASIYAIKLACDMLQTRRTDLMLAGGVNGIDELFVLMGFSDLHAISRSGQSRPFDCQADGLLPASGCGLFVLKRLSDAERDQDRILGVIRGIGLSNDGHSSGLLAPSVRGQVLAMQRAYQAAHIDPASISFLECHATGTHVGDIIELQSLKQVFATNTQLALGALKGNIGHALTSSSSAAISRVLSAFKHRQLPPIKQLDHPLEELRQTHLHIPLTLEPWEASQGPLRAAVNGFGMGGTNAHIILEAWEGKSATESFSSMLTAPKPEVAIIALSVMAGSCVSTTSFAEHLLQGQSVLEEIPGIKQAKIQDIELPLKLHVPPNDLKETLGQQLAILHTGLSAMAEVKKPLLGEKTGIYVGMSCDPQVACYTIRWLLEGLLIKQGIPYSKKWLDQALESIFSPGNPARVLGAMPNVIASRLAMEWDCQGPCLAICSEELSGIRAFEIACDALERGEIDMAVVAAVDMSCEMVHQQAAKVCLSELKQNPGDAAVLMILKRLADAQQDEESIYAIVDPSDSPASYQLTETSFSHLFGHAHAASGLLSLAAATIAVQQQLLPADSGKQLPIPWVPNEPICRATVQVRALGGQQSHISLRGQANQLGKAFFRQKIPQIYCYSGHDTPTLSQALADNQQSNTGPSRLVIIADSPAMLDQRRQIAINTLERNNKAAFSLPHQGIYFRSQPLAGKIAMVFATSNTFYPDMGADLSLAFPQLMPQIHQRYPRIQEVLQILYGAGGKIDSYVQETWVTAYLSCLHYLISTDILGIQPDAVIGHSRGEAIALNVLNIHRNLAEMNDYAINSGLFTDLLAGNYQALRQTYPELSEEQIGWENWRIGHNVEEAKAVIEAQPYCHLTIINSAQDFVLSGIPQACQQVIAQLKPLAAAKLSMDFMVHSPEVKAVGDIWRRMHDWETHPVDLQFYSCITGHPYALNRDSVAEHMLKIGTEQVDFPRLIHNAYADGVRIFIEHGPQGLCSRWIKEILGDKDCVITHYDQPGRSSLNQLHYLIAELLAAGVNLTYQRELLHA